MADRIIATYTTGASLYAVLKNSAGQFWYTTGSAYEAYNAAHWANYAVALTEDGVTGIYGVAFPAVTAGATTVIVKVGASPAVGDPIVGGTSGYWDGTTFRADAGQTGDAYAVVNNATYGNAAIAAAVGNIAITGSPTYSAPSSYTLTTGNQTSGTYANVDSLNQTYHVHTDAAGTLSLIYHWTLRPDEQASQALFSGRWNGTNDTLIFEIYDWTTAGYVQWFTQVGVAGTTSASDFAKTVGLVAKYTSTAANGTAGVAGLVNIRIRGTGLTSCMLSIDQLVLGVSNTSRTVGYSQGAIWVDSTGVSGTVPFVNGTADNACPWADALTIAAALGMRRFVIEPATTVTLGDALSGKTLSGTGWFLDLNGQQLTGVTFMGAERVTGTATKSGAESWFHGCEFGQCSLPEFDGYNCALSHTMTLTEATSYKLDKCYAINIGDGWPIIDFGAAVGATGLCLTAWHGYLTVKNMKAGDVLEITGAGDLTLDSSCTGGTVMIAGAFAVTNSGSGQTITQTGRFGTDQVMADTAGTGTLLTRLPQVVTFSSVGGVQMPEVDVRASMGTASAGQAGYFAPDWGHVYAPTTEATVGAIADAVWDEVLTGATHNVPSSSGRRLRQLAAQIIVDGLAASSTNNTVTLDADASSVDGAYDPSLIYIATGTGAGQCRLVLEYDGDTKTAVVDRNWKVNPNTDSTYVIMGDAGREHVNEGLAQGGDATHITLNALASHDDNCYIAQRVFIRSGTGEDQSRRVIAYNGTTKVATVSRAWDVTPDATSAYVMLPTGAINDNDIAAALLDEPTTDHVTTGTTGKAMDDLRQVLATEVSGTVNDASPAVTGFKTSLQPADAQFYANQFLVFTTGDLIGQARKLGAGSLSGGYLVVAWASGEDDLTAAPTNGDAFRITGRAK